MLKQTSTKPKQPPWIPAGKSNLKNKKIAKSQVTKAKPGNVVSPRKSPDKTFTVEGEKEIIGDDGPDVMSMSSDSSSEVRNEASIHLFSIYQEMKLLYIHFASLKSSYLSAHRLIDLQNIDDSSITESLKNVGISLKDMNHMFEDLEYYVCVLENTLVDDQKMQRYSEVFAVKEKMLSQFFELYEKLIIIFQSVFEKQDFKEMVELKESLSKKLELEERKSVSQDAIIKDLERRLSIYQGKTNAMESYKTNLEGAKAELEKQLMQKESQIKYLSNELLNASGKLSKPDHEDFIEIMETMKSKAHSEKSALKKALKFQKAQSEKAEEKYKELMQELKEKEKMVFDIAAQRDQLKVQLTVISNNIIQQKNQIEELKIQNSKLQNEMTEKDTSHEKQMSKVQNSLEEKSSLLENTMKGKKNLENTIEELEKELEATKKQFKNLKTETESAQIMDFPKPQSDVIFQEMHRLSSLLQNTREVFENFKLSSHTVSAGGDHPEKPMELGGVEKDILAAVMETKQHLSELKTFLEEQREIQVTPKKNDVEKQLKKLEDLYSESVKENEALKLEVEDLKNASLTNSSVKKSENYFTANMPGDNFTRKLQLELMKKSDEIIKLKYEFKQNERDLEDQLKEYKDKLKAMEIDSPRVISLENELKSTKLELSMLQKKKEEETESLLRRTKELQDSLDLKSAEYETLQRYVQVLKSSYFNVFGGS